MIQAAGVVKLADTPDLGSGAERCAGSSPVTRINTKRIPFKPTTHTEVFNI